MHRRGAHSVRPRLPSHLADMASKPASLAGYAAACVRWRVTVTWAHVVLLLIVNVAVLQLLFRNMAELQGENAALRMREEGLRLAGPRGYVLQEPRRLFMKKRNRKPQWRWVRGPGVKWGVGLKRLLELEASPERWGAECRAFATRAPTQRVLVAVPFRESMPDSITERLASLLGELECGSAAAGFQLTLGLTSASAPKESRDLTGRGRISAVRSGLVARFLRPEHAYVLWLDADIVDAPADLVARLHAANPGGVSAPAVVIEDSNSSAYHQRRCGRDDCSAFNGMVGHKGYQFYDAAAFFEAGHIVRARRSKDEVRRLGHSNTGTVRVWPPYMGNRTDVPGNGGVVDCESVGTVYLVPAEVRFGVARALRPLFFLLRARSLRRPPAPLPLPPRSPREGVPLLDVRAGREVRPLRDRIHRALPHRARGQALLWHARRRRARRHRAGARARAARRANKGP